MRRFWLSICFGLFSFSLWAQTISKYILVDQFGYTTTAKKIAMMRDPQTGYDASESFSPSGTYALVNAQTALQVYTAAPVAWNNGNTDASSGDKVWHFDFSSIQTPGEYYVLDVNQNLRSYTFLISDTVYKGVLKAALRMLYYQRAGFAKRPAFAGIGWADSASHVGPLQDRNCRRFNAASNASTERDLSGGWYDAGDYNRYTSWNADYVVTLARAYRENPTIFTDDYNIPESGNGVPDILDELKWGVDWMLKMQNSDGSMISVLGVAGASPPSSSTGQSLYGLPNTIAAAKSAGAFAMASKVFRLANSTLFGIYADTLQARAIKAWNWSIANPSVIFNNGQSANGTQNLAAGNQETDSLGRFTAKMGSALYLYDLTGNSQYLNVWESNYTEFPLYRWSQFVDQYRHESQDLMCFYLGLSGISNTVANSIRTNLLTALNKSGNYFGQWSANTDPYRAYIKDYNWGSSRYKANYGMTFWNAQNANLTPSLKNDYWLAAEEYLHYIHGVNPFNFTYLTNMSSYGAENSITEIYHTWFFHGNAKWDKVGVSTYGPAPGFLAGGPNSSYNWDGCCPSNCGSAGNNALCNSITTTPPKGQPAQKSYKDFNNSWPINSWSVTEPSNSYQVAYIHLLSKYTKIQEKNVVTAVDATQELQNSIQIYPNPNNGLFHISFPQAGEWEVSIQDVEGKTLKRLQLKSTSLVYMEKPTPGVYMVHFKNQQTSFIKKLVIE